MIKRTSTIPYQGGLRLRRTLSIPTLSLAHTSLSDLRSYFFKIFVIVGRRPVTHLLPECI